MLSYRHAFHVGNHADVIKHLTLVQVIRHLLKKEKPFWYIDTHAGAGRYALNNPYTLRLEEYNQGIARLWQAPKLPITLQEYLEAIKAINSNGILTHYPGSPEIAWRMLRQQDRMRLFERHSTDFQALKLLLPHKHIIVSHEDGFKGMKALLPPPPRRALVLIDPSYEEPEDYACVIKCLEDAINRFATGIYMLWYPQLSKPASQNLPNQLKMLEATSWLHVAMSVRQPSADGFGLHGSGLFIINPPWQLHAQLEEAMPVLSTLLSQDNKSYFVLEHHNK